MRDGRPEPVEYEAPRPDRGTRRRRDLKLLASIGAAFGIAYCAALFWWFLFRGSSATIREHAGRDRPWWRGRLARA